MPAGFFRLILKISITQTFLNINELKEQMKQVLEEIDCLRFGKGDVLLLINFTVSCGRNVLVFSENPIESTHITVADFLSDIFYA